VRNRRTGYGDQLIDTGRNTAPRRGFSRFSTWGPLDQYPTDPNAIVPARAISRDTTLYCAGA